MTTRKTTTKHSTRTPPVAFDDAARQLVRVLAGWGMPHADIATQVSDSKTGKAGITLATLHEHFGGELDKGPAHLIATAVRTQFDLMTKGRTETRERVSARILRRHGFADGDGVVLHVQSGTDATGQGEGEVDAAELEKAVMAFLHRRADRMATRWLHRPDLATPGLHGDQTAKSPTGGAGLSACFPARFLVGRAGLEPATNGLKVRCSTN